MIKIIDSVDPDDSTVSVTTNPDVDQEDKVHEEVERLEASFEEIAPIESEKWPMD